MSTRLIPLRANDRFALIRHDADNGESAVYVHRLEADPTGAGVVVAPSGRWEGSAEWADQYADLLASRFPKRLGHVTFGSVRNGLVREWLHVGYEVA